jgi:FkbM family methyltransferase
MIKQPFISIITVVFNGEKYLEETILSVINQTYNNFEYIIIDGGSTDGTVDIIKKYENYLAYWISEKDKGISDAFNKGLKASSGDYINFQGDGDGFVSTDAIDKVFQDINPDEDIFVSAKIQRIDEDGNEIFISKHVDNFDKKSLLFRMSLPHQGLFTHRSYFKKYGLFDVNNTFCMDYEHLLRAYHEFPKVVTKNIIVARWRDDGLGNGRTLEILDEYDRIKRDNMIASELVLDFVKYWILFKYYVKKIIGDIKVLNILRYIWNKNIGLNKLKYLFLGIAFQIFKRLTKSVISKEIFNGKKIFLYPNCNVSSMYAYTDIPDRGEIQLLRDIIVKKEGKKIVFLDIGANIGSYSISMMEICDEVVAFEPHPYTAKRCKMNFLLNNFPENNVKQLALSNKVGKIHFSDYGGSSTINHILENRNGIEVEVSTLDNFIKDNNYTQDNNYIIKVDVEGFEKQVFEGGKKFLTSYDIKGIIFECFSQDEVFKVLKSYGYKNIEKISENNYFATKN